MLIDVTDTATREDVVALIEGPPLTVSWFCWGMGSHHNMPCAIYPEEFAMHNGNTGAFHPSHKANTEGWRLRQIRPGREWLFNLVENWVFKGRYER